MRRNPGAHSAGVLMSLLATTLAGCQSGGENGGGSGSAAAPPAAKLNPAKVQARAKQPPPPGAEQRGSIGHGQLSMRTFNHPGDGDSYWVEEIDIDGDGALERAELLWDDEDRVLFAYAQTDVPCQAGGIAVVAVLVAVNAEGNHRGRPAGSGIYSAIFDASECGASVAGLYGAAFDPAGVLSRWVAVKMDDDNDNFNTDRPF